MSLIGFLLSLRKKNVLVLFTHRNEDFVDKKAGTTCKPDISIYNATEGVVNSMD